MIDSFKEYSFVRKETSGIYFTDIKLSMDFSVKYDIYDNDILCGTVIDNSGETFAKFNDGIELRRKFRWFDFSGKHYLKTQDGLNYATISVKKTIFRFK